MSSTVSLHHGRWQIQWLGHASSQSPALCLIINKRCFAFLSVLPVTELKRPQDAKYGFLPLWCSSIPSHPVLSSSGSSPFYTVFVMACSYSLICKSRYSCYRTQQAGEKAQACFLFMPHRLQDLSSPHQDWTQRPKAVEKPRILTTRPPESSLSLTLRF